MPIPNRNFVDCGLDGPRFRDQEWFTYQGWAIRTHRGLAAAAIVIIGADDSTTISHFDQAMGWVIQVPLESSEAPLTLWSLLRRLGVALSETVVAVLPNCWEIGLELLEQNELSRFVWVWSPEAQSPSDRFPGQAEVGNFCFRVDAKVRSSEGVLARSTLLVPSTSLVEPASYTWAIVPYQPTAIAFDRPGGLRKLNLALAASSCAAVSGGSVAAVLNAVFSTRSNPPYEGWLAKVAGTSAVVRTTGVRLLLGVEGLVVHGFDAHQTKLGLGWGSRGHRLLLKGPDGSCFDFSLGSLNRAVLDTLTASTGELTNSYSAFASPKGLPLDLSSVPPGVYCLELVDEFGDDVLADSGRVDVPFGSATHAGREFHIEHGAAGWELRVSDTGPSKLGGMAKLRSTVRSVLSQGDTT